MKTSWFRQHLHLTWLVWLLIFCFVPATLGAFLGFDFLGKGNNATYMLLWLMLPVNGWVLKRKGRSLGWLFLALFLPFIPLILANNRAEAAKPALPKSPDLPDRQDQPN